MRLHRFVRRAKGGDAVVRAMLRRGLRPLTLSACVVETGRVSVLVGRAERRVMLQRARLIRNDERRKTGVGR